MAHSISDAELAELGVRRKPQIRLAPFALVLVLIGVAVFLFSYYLPLQNAHKLLQTEYSKLAPQAAELDDALKATRTELGKVDKRREELQEQVNTTTRAGNYKTQQLALLEKGLAGSLTKALQRKLINVVREQDTLRATFSNQLLFQPHSFKLTPHASTLLCTASKEVAKDQGLRLAVVAHAKEEKPSSPVIAKTQETSWEATTAAAGAIARSLVETCEFPAARLSAEGVANQGTLEAMRDDGVTLTVTVTDNTPLTQQNDEPADAKPAGEESTEKKAADSSE